MRVMRVVLLMLSLALLMSVAAFAEPSSQSTSMDQQELEAAIFGTPVRAERATPQFAYGLCSMTCDPCWSNADCPKIGGRIQTCNFACN